MALVKKVKKCPRFSNENNELVRINHVDALYFNAIIMLEY